MKKLIIKKFSAEWCGPCKAMAPIFKKVSQMQEFNDCIFIEYDVEDENNADEVEKYHIMSLPTIIITNENGDEITKKVGSVSESNLISTIKEALNKTF